MSMSRSEAQEKGGKTTKKKNQKTRRLSVMRFGSDAEEDLNTVVSDNPQLYNRSFSLVSFRSHFLS